MAKISNLLIGLVIISGIAALMGLSMVGFQVEYGVDYDNESLTSMDQMAELQDKKDEIEQEVRAITDPDEDWLDKIGAMFKGGYATLLFFIDSLSLSDSFIDESVDGLNLGESTKIVKTMIILIIAIIILVGIILSTVVKREV